MDFQAYFPNVPMLLCEMKSACDCAPNTRAQFVDLTLLAFVEPSLRVLDKRSLYLLFKRAAG